MATVIANNGAGNGMGFEMSFGPAIVDNNVLIGGGPGVGITGDDASAVAVAHNFIANFTQNYKGGGEAVMVFSLTGRTCGGGKHGWTCAIRNWTVAGNLLFCDPRAPWARLHLAKNGSHGEPLVTNDTLTHNLCYGQTPTFGNRGVVNGTKPPGVEIDGNMKATQGFTAALNLTTLQLTITADSTIGQSGCLPGGPGGDVDFSGSRRAAVCTPGPFDGLKAGTTRTISLWPVPSI